LPLTGGVRLLKHITVVNTMTSRQLSISQLVELNSIKKDAHFYLKLFDKLHNRESSGVLFPSLVPYYSLFTIESHKHLQKICPQYALSLSNRFQAIIQASRMRTKYFDDTRKRVDGTFELLDWIADFHRKWHIGGHRGCLAPIKRAIQDDLGVFFYQGHVIGSTHTGILNLGYSRGDLPTTSESISSTIGTLSFSVGKELGEYIAKVVSFPEFAPDSTELKDIDDNLQDEMLGYMDVKSSKYLTSTFNGRASEAINLSLMLFFTQVNFLQYILNNLVAGASCTLFKLKYIVLYHLTSSLRKLQNYCYREQILTDHSLGHLQAIVTDRDLGEIASQSAFRNILVHYGIRDVPAELLSYDTKLYGLVEHFFDGRTYDEVADIVDKQIERTSAILEEWLNWPVSQSRIRNW
jgi:hypothetical protein